MFRQGALRITFLFVFFFFTFSFFFLLLDYHRPGRFLIRGAPTSHAFRNFDAREIHVYEELI